MKITEMALLILCGGKQRLSAQYIYRITISCHIVIPSMILRKQLRKNEQ